MKNKAFTLVELMLVVIIISVLVAMIAPRMAGRSEQARNAVAKADVDLNIATAIKLYEMDTGSYPASLDALLVVSDSYSGAKGPYLEKKTVDPWGRDYQYKNPGTHKPYSYDLYSLGKDGIESSDDITNWE